MWVINRNTVKVSYRTMTNMSKVISKHNTMVVKRTAEPGSNCNCRATHLLCYMNNQCLAEAVIYNAKVTATLPPPRPTIADHLRPPPRRS